MSMKLKRILAMGLLISVVSQSLLAVRPAFAGGESAPFEEAITYIFRENEAGISIVRRMTGAAPGEISDSTFRSFNERLGWKNSKLFNTELRTETKKIELAFEDYRVSKGRAAKMGPGEELLPDEREFLDKAAAALSSNNRLENLLQEQLTFVDANVGTRGGGDYRINRQAFVGGAAAPEGEIPARPDPAVANAFNPESTTDLRDLQLNWWNKLWMRFRAVRGFVSTLVLGEGDWRNLYLKSGKPFTANDLSTIRKYNRLLDSLNDYSQMRLMVRAFANEPAAVYARLAEMTAAETQEFQQGFETIDSYVNGVKAKSKSLPLNDIVYETQRRILNVLERCTTLGGKLNGTELGEGDIVRAERNVTEAETSLHSAEASIEADRVSGDQFALRRHIADRDLWRNRLDLSTQVLEDKSVEFVKNRDMIEIFANLRGGKVNGETVAAFDMADPFVPTQEQLDAWEKVYERALARSTNQMVKDELSLAARTQLGETRKIVRALNKVTKQVDGRLFTDTEIGQGLEEYAQHGVLTAVIRLGKILGIAVPTAEGARIAKVQVDKFIKSLTSDDPSKPATPGGSAHPQTPVRSSPASPATPGTSANPITAHPGSGGTTVHPAGHPGPVDPDEDDDGPQ